MNNVYMNWPVVPTDEGKEAQFKAFLDADSVPASVLHCWLFVTDRDEMASSPNPSHPIGDADTIMSVVEIKEVVYCLKSSKVYGVNKM